MREKMPPASIITAVKEFKSSLSVDDIVNGLNQQDFWMNIMPTHEKYIEIRGPNVVYSKAADNFVLDPLGVTATKVEFSGEMIFEDKGSDKNGRFVDFYIRDNSILNELDGRIRIRPVSGGLKVGIFIYSLSMKDNPFSVGKSATELILRNKLRELLDLLAKL